MFRLVSSPDLAVDYKYWSHDSKKMISSTNLIRLDDFKDQIRFIQSSLPPAQICVISPRRIYKSGLDWTAERLIVDWPLLSSIERILAFYCYSLVLSSLVKL